MKINVMIKYIFKKSIDYSKKDLFKIVCKLDSYFKPLLSDRIDLLEYTNKMDKYSNTVMAIDGENQPVGVISFYDNDKVTKNGFITFLGVLKSHQGQGIASKLITLCLSECQLTGIERVLVKTELDNTGAIELYKKKGFEEMEIIHEHGVKKIKFFRDF